MPTRLISFAGSTIAIMYEGTQPARIVNFLTRNLKTAAEDAVPHITFSLFVNNHNQLCLQQPGKADIESDSAAKIAQILLGNSGSQLADRSQDGLLFHAAGVAWQGSGLLLPGTMGAGKTTLTAWLLSKGFNYLSDELVFFSQHSLSLQGFGRPLNIKRPSRPVLSKFIDFQQDSRILSTTAGNLVPAEVINPDTPDQQPALHQIIFPNYQANSPFECQQLTQAQAVLGLMKCLINARNLPEHGIQETSRLAQVVPAYKMTYSSFSQLDDQLKMLLKVS